MYAFFPRKGEICNTSTWSFILLLCAIMRKNHVKIFLIYVTAEFYVPPGCLEAAPKSY